MKIIYLLTVFFYLPGGGGIDGNQVDGWSPCAYSTFEECKERMSFANKQQLPEWAGGWVWACHSAPENWRTK